MTDAQDGEVKERKTASPHDSENTDEESDDSSLDNGSTDSDGSSSDDDEIDASSDDDGEPKGKDDKALSKYRQLASRRVDLVGDYAGNELFLIEGDSLLLNAFGDGNLDLTPGCQVLQATYNVELFLRNLIQRKCRFNIVFFQSNRLLCVPPNQRDPTNFLLARSAIFRHLQVNLTRTHPSVVVRMFESWHAEEFIRYLHDTSPYFIMAHDGAEAVDRQSKFMTDDSEQPSGTNEVRVPLRKMILSFIAQGFNVALINGLEWRDTKAMTMVLELRKRQTSLRKWDSDDPAIPTVDTTVELKRLLDFDAGLTERQLIAIIVIVKILTEDPTPATKELALAFLRHQALLSHVPLSARRISFSKHTKSDQGARSFLSTFCTAARDIPYQRTWRESLSSGTVCDTHDILDGRLFFHTVQAGPQLDAACTATLQRLTEATKSLLNNATFNPMSNAEPSADSGESVPNTAPPSSTDTNRPQGDQRGLVDTHDSSVLPFSNRVFDKHLASVQIDVDATAEENKSLAAYRIYQEVSHWHNSKRPLAKKGPPTPMDKRQALREARRNQQFMAEMRTYAASLTNAVGKSLEPETIIVGQARQIAPSQLQQPEHKGSDTENSATPKNKAANKKGGGGKTAQKNAAKQAMMDKLAADKSRKVANVQDNILGSWQTACKGFESDADPRERYRKAKSYMSTIPKASWDIVAPECDLYMLACLVKLWIAACEREEKSRSLPVAALIWNHVRSISRYRSVPKTISKCLEETVNALHLPPVQHPTSDGQSDRKPTFDFPLPTKAAKIAIGLSYRDFQLIEAGPYLERSFDSRPDPRVDFQPDGWQRKVLDGIDADQSVFVVAPTSAGKTFISFYAMRKVLEADDDGVLVYVAPTKALVNQLAAEIQARFSKSFKYGGKSVWAIHTRDYRINNAAGCQVLVTVPHILQIMLLAGSHAKTWSSRVKRIIFDEVHSIGQAEDGVVWEQLLLMAPCPIIALSATVGNPEEFSSWLGSTQDAIGNELVTVQHPYRYSDLRKYYYESPRQFSFRGLPDKKAFGVLGLEGLTGFRHIHPVAALVDKSRGIPQDLALEPHDCLILWRAMTKVQTPSYPVPADLAPSEALPEICRKLDILEWEKNLKRLLQVWLENHDSPFDALLQIVETSFREEQPEELYNTAPKSDRPGSAVNTGNAAELTSTTLPLLCRLQEQDALPAILFNYDRHQCEKICKSLLQQLQQAEKVQQKSGQKWEKHLERWEQWKTMKEKATSKTAKTVTKKSKKSSDDGDEKTSKLDQQKDAAGTDDTKWASFDPEAPVDGYHFADYTKLQLSELDGYLYELRRRGLEPWLSETLARGIGVHHAGMNRKYRQVVEILFRRGFLRVIIATGTLALGINMPCKTVVFSGDSVFLTALNYRQCAGRAGRRGFDLLGNIVFQGISRAKVCRLISSRLPDLNGHFPITTTLVLRLFTLLNDSGFSKYAVSAIDALLSQPRLHMGGPSFKDQTMHHLRFSIEYLRRQQLLGMDGAPLNFAGLVSHLYFTENSSFAFHTLLKEGFFHELCADVRQDEKGTLLTLMLVMAHLFNRVYCRQADTEYLELVKASSSIVFLPPLPEKAAQILRDHNRQTLNIYQAYVSTFIDQHISEPDNALPLTEIVIGGTSQPSEPFDTLPPVRVRSPFVALSGSGDDFDSVHDMCSTVRAGVFLEEAVIPSMSLYPDDVTVPLNAWLLDFFKHGDVYTLERANGIRRADVWFYLNDFSLVLVTIVTSLRNFLKPGGGDAAGDLGMLDLRGELEVRDEEQEDEVLAAMEAASEASGPSVADSAIAMMDSKKGKPAANVSGGKKKGKTMESWEDFSEEEEDKGAGDDGVDLMELMGETSWEGKGGKGLLDVLRAFEKLHAEFTVKFKAMWA